MAKWTDSQAHTDTAIEWGNMQRSYACCGQDIIPMPLGTAMMLMLLLLLAAVPSLCALCK